ncbi:hypothetical protein B0H19DRAFT_1056702 [Mycena capillaripes]|nr:hypothetical protein B0H19DRAFT_1056702 [Mycena capillaripes]
MRAHCIVAIFAFIIPLSFALISVDTPFPGKVELDHGHCILSASPPNIALENLGPTTAPSYAWNVAVGTAGTAILSVQDSLEDSGQSLPFTIQVRRTLGGACDTQVESGSLGLPVASPPTGIKVDNSSATASSPQGGSQPTDPSTDPSTTSQQGSDSTSIDSGQDSSPTGSPASSPSSSTSSPTSFIQPSTHSAAAFDFNSGSSSSRSDATNSLSSSTFTLPETPGDQGGQILPATTVLQSGESSSATGQTGGSNNSFSKKNVMSGSIIGGIIAAVLLVLLAAFCVLRRCRRRRSNTPDTTSYPFGTSDTAISEASVPREMVGRSGYPASTFSSWGNHGDLDERALSPGVGSSEGLPLWENGQSTIESRYQAAVTPTAFTPGHTASSSSIDRNDPSSHHRFRGPIPKSMTDAYHAGPSSPSTAIMGEQPSTADLNDGYPAQGQGFDEIRPQQAMPSWGTVHDAMTGRRPIVGYPPPYTSK